MFNDARLITSILIHKGKGAFEGLESLVNVGGGIGTLAKAIADAFPHLECTVFDLPCVVDGMQGNNNLKYVESNMFEAIPATNAVLLNLIFINSNAQQNLLNIAFDSVHYLCLLF